MWEKPKDGFMSLKEYNKLNQTVISKQEEARQKDLKFHLENADEIASKYKREQFKKYQKITQEPMPEESSSSVNYVNEFSQPYGKWETVEAEPERKHVDLELPKQQNEIYYAVSNVKPEEPVRVFKEKTVHSLESDDIPSVFKKRKIGNRNIRKNNDES